MKKSSLKEKVIILIILALMAFFIFSCETWHLGWVVKHKDEVFPIFKSMIETRDTTEILFDTTQQKSFSKEPNFNNDSIFLEMLFECDSNNQVILRSVEERDSIINSIQNKRPDVDYKYLFNHGLLKLSLFQDSIFKLNQIITIQKKEIQKKTIISPPVIQKEYPSQFFYWWFGITAILSIIIIIFKLKKQ